MSFSLEALLLVMLWLEAQLAAVPPWACVSSAGQHPCGSPLGEQGRLHCEDSQSPSGSPSRVQSCTPQNVTGDGRIWVVLELEVTDLGVVQPESMSVCTVLPSENKYR